MNGNDQQRKKISVNKLHEIQKQRKEKDHYVSKRSNEWPYFNRKKTKIERKKIELESFTFVMRNISTVDSMQKKAHGIKISHVHSLIYSNDAFFLYFDSNLASLFWFRFL